MNKKNVTTQANDSENRFTIKDLPVELAELSDETLSKVCGGRVNPKFFRLQRFNTVDAVDPATLHPELNDYNPMIVDPESYYHPGIF
jgi:hypothetical protein